MTEFVPLYKLEPQLLWIWGEMRKRCLDPNSKHFKNYGGRGITVCARWDDYYQFVSDMGPRPDGLTLERKDNDRGYEPSNCCWATRYEQAGNRRYCIYVDDAGERVNLKEYCRRHGLKYRPTHKRITMRGWSIERAISDHPIMVN